MGADQPHKRKTAAALSSSGLAQRFRGTLAALQSHDNPANREPNVFKSPTRRIPPGFGHSTAGKLGGVNTRCPAISFFKLNYLGHSHCLSVVHRLINGESTGSALSWSDKKYVEIQQSQK